MENKTKYFLIGGVVGTTIALIAQTLIISKCSEFGCIFLIALFALPGLLLQDVVAIGLATMKIINATFYFVIGGLLGLLINKLKNK